MGAETVADLFIKLSLITDPFSKGAKQAVTDGESMITKMGGVGSAMSKLGEGVAAGGVGIAAVSLKMASDFEANMARLYTAAGAPKAAVKGATDTVLQLGNAVGFSGTQIAEALYHPVSAGLDLATSLQAVKYSAQEAQISGASLDDTTYALSSVMKAFGIDASGAHDTMAQLNAIVGQGDMRFQDFNASVKNWAPTAASMGISIDSMGAALAYLTDRGNSAEEASTRLTMGLSMMATPSKQAQKLLEGLGVSSSDVAASTEQMTQVMKKTGITQNDLAKDLQSPDGIYVALKHLQDSLHAAGVSGTEADSIISKIFGGGRSDKAIMSLLQNLDGLKTKFGDITSASGQFDKAWGDTQQTFSFKMKQVGADLENVGIKIGLVLIPAVEAVVGWFTQHKAATEALAAAIGVVLAAALLRFVQMMTTSVIKSIAAVITAFQNMGTAAKTTAGETEALGTTVGNTGKEAEGAALATGGWATKLGNSIPIIGGVIAGAGFLGTKLNDLATKGDEAAASVDQYTTALLNSSGAQDGAATGLGKLGTALQSSGAKIPGVTNPMAQMGVQLGLMSQKLNVGGDSLKNYDGGLAALVSGGHATEAKQVIDQIAAATDNHGKKLINTARDFPQYYAALDAVAAHSALAANSTDAAAGSLSNLTPQLDAADQAAQDAADAIKQVDDAFSTLANNISSSSDLDNFKKDLLGVTDELKANGSSLSDTTIKGLQNRDSFRSAAQAILTYRDAQIKNKVSTDDANKTASDQAAQLIKVWEQAGANKTQVEAYAKQLGLIPKDLKTNLTLQQSNLDAVIGKLQRLNDAMAGVNPGAASAAGPRRAMSVGGPVVGPGSPTSDSVAVDLSNGEFVVSAAGTAKTPRGVLDALNSGNVSLARSLLGTDFTGPASGLSGGIGGGVVNNYYQQTVVVQGTVLAERDLRDVTQQQFLQLGGRNSTSYTPYKR